jgi:hypothetical protein
LTGIIRRHSFDPARTIMAGDRLDTDILFGKNGGIATLLVMTGEYQVFSLFPKLFVLSRTPVFLTHFWPHPYSTQFHLPFSPLFAPANALIGNGPAYTPGRNCHRLVSPPPPPQSHATPHFISQLRSWRSYRGDKRNDPIQSFCRLDTRLYSQFIGRSPCSDGVMRVCVYLGTRYQ